MTKLKLRHFGDYVQAIKPGITNVITLGSNDNSFIQRTKKTSTIKLITWVKFDEVDFDGVHVIVQAFRDGRQVSISQPLCNLYAIEQGASWDKTPITSKPLSQDGLSWVASYLANELPDLLADRTLYVETKTTRLKKRLFFEGYFNHLGALDFMTRNKKKISFLDLTKVDE